MRIKQMVKDAVELMFDVTVDRVNVTNGSACKAHAPMAEPPREGSPQRIQESDRDPRSG